MRRRRFLLSLLLLILLLVVLWSARSTATSPRDNNNNLQLLTNIIADGVGQGGRKLPFAATSYSSTRLTRKI